MRKGSSNTASQSATRRPRVRRDVPRIPPLTREDRWREAEAIAAALALVEYFNSPEYRYGHAGALAR